MMSPPGNGSMDTPVTIIPTYISTDLITPGRTRRETLPAIGNRLKSPEERKLWGQETKLSATGEELAYHHFKPSYLMNKDNDHAVVTHRHYGSRTYNTMTQNQPYDLTNLLLSKCRMNDERMPQPFQSTLIHKHHISEPYPTEFCNRYLSHRCKFQVFPTNGVDLIDAATTSTQQPAKQNLRESTTEALKKIRQHYYGISTYNLLHEEAIKQMYTKLKKTKPTVRFKVSIEICKRCGLQINRNQDRKNSRIDSPPPQPTPHRHQSGVKKGGKILSKRKSAAIFCVTAGNDANTVVENKYQGVKSLLTSTTDNNRNEHFCQCKKKLPLTVNRVKVSRNPSLILMETKPQPPTCLLDDGMETKEQCTGKLLDPAVTMETQRYERGFKTEARHRFLEEYEDEIPNLRDAVTEGRKHNFEGYNVHIFRG